MVGFDKSAETQHQIRKSAVYHESAAHIDLISGSKFFDVYVVPENGCNGQQLIRPVFSQRIQNARRGHFQICSRNTSSSANSGWASNQRGYLIANVYDIQIESHHTTLFSSESGQIAEIDHSATDKRSSSKQTECLSFLIFFQSDHSCIVMALVAPRCAA